MNKKLLWQHITEEGIKVLEEDALPERPKYSFREEELQKDRIRIHNLIMHSLAYKQPPHKENIVG